MDGINCPPCIRCGKLENYTPYVSILCGHQVCCRDCAGVWNLEAIIMRQREPLECKICSQRYLQNHLSFDEEFATKYQLPKPSKSVIIRIVRCPKFKEWIDFTWNTSTTIGTIRKKWLETTPTKPRLIFAGKLLEDDNLTLDGMRIRFSEIFFAV